MSDEKNVGGHVPHGGRSDPGTSPQDQLSHVERKCIKSEISVTHFTAKDGDTVCECGAVDLLKPVVMFTPVSAADRSIAAMADFADAIRDLPKNEQRAAIYWLADYFLGIKWWGHQ